MKTKQVKEEQDKSIEEEPSPIEPKTRARKKATDIEEKSQDEPKTSKDKKSQSKPKAIVKKRPLGIRKTLRSKRTAAVKETVKHVIKQTAKRGRKPAIKPDPDTVPDKGSISLIPASEIKKEPSEETTPNSRSSSPKTAGRRQRVGSDLAIMKTMLSDSPSSLVLGPRTSPYSMRSERSNSPSLSEGKNLRSGKPRKVKNNLLNEVVKKEQNKRRRLLSDSKNPEAADGEDCKKLKRGRSCSRDGSEISKCSDNTESDLSMSETLNDSDRELNKKLDKSKTDLGVDIENNVQISTIEKVPSKIDSKLTEPKLGPETSSIVNEKKKLSLTRSTSLDSDNNNSNRIKLETLNTSDIEDKQSLKTENDTLFQARSNILTIMSETFNSKAMAKNIRRARRGKKAAAEGRKLAPEGRKPAPTERKLATKEAKKIAPTCSITQDTVDEKQETIETLSKDIDDLIKNLDQNIDRDQSLAEPAVAPELKVQREEETIPISKFYSLDKSNDKIIAPETPVKEKEVSALINESTPSKIDEGETIRLHYEDSTEKGEGPRHEIAYKCNTVASIDKLMDRLKEFEEFDKRRQRQESESKSSDHKPMMVTNDVVLITKSGADIKPLKDIQSVRSPERPIEKENVLSCFENNSAISIVKRDLVRKSLDVDLPNSVTLIKRKNSVSARKESTSSNHSREPDAISIFEKSLGKDVTLTEIKKSVDRSAIPSQVDFHQFATLHPTTTSQIGGVLLDSSQISITPRVSDARPSEIQIIKRKSREESMTRKSSELTEIDDKMATIEKIKSPTHQSQAILFATVASAPVASALVAPALVATALAAPAPVAPALVHPALVTPALVAPAIVAPTLVATTPVPVAPVSMVPAPVDPTSMVPATVAPASVVPAPVAPASMVPAPGAPASIAPAPVSLTSVVPAPVAIKSPEAATVQTEALPPAVETIKPIPDEINVGSVVPALEEPIPNENPKEQVEDTTTIETKVEQPEPEKIEENSALVITEKLPDLTEKQSEISEKQFAVTKKEADVTEKMEVVETPNIENAVCIMPEQTEVKNEDTKNVQPETQIESKETLSETKSEVKEEEKPAKCGRPSKSARSSIESLPGPSSLLETPESQRRKENVLRTLGLLTHKAAKEAKIEKLREKERIYSGMAKGKAAKSSGDYTGTLKTVIKLNRTGGEREKKKNNRSSLKMTFQKSKYRSGKQITDVGDMPADDTFYTIERREAGGAGAPDEGEAIPEPTEPKETLNLVIPEKASSFSIHPGRLCQDQCFYCGGKFGLFDTPCHIAQIKSRERQKKVLDNEEKLTIDSCLCDACYRHVDRRANCPSYRKRPLPKNDQPPLPQASQGGSQAEPQPVLPGPGSESEEEHGATATGRPATCHTEACVSVADHSIRRKWLIKMRSSVNTVLKLKGDYPGLHTIPLCGEHYRALTPLMACVMCRRRLTKHHNLHFIHHGYSELNPLLSAASLPVRFHSRPVLCKACRYYCTLLQRPGHNDTYATLYRRKLLQIYNIEVPPEPEGPENPPDDRAIEDHNKHKKKQRNKSKQRKSTEPESNSSETSEKTNDDSTPEKKEKEGEPEKQQPIEEDIESLISSNKILVPGAVKPNETTPSDGSENESVFDFETPVLPVDKQTELQYLLQKQNNPAQFMHGQPNLTQKQKNFIKIQSITGIQKPGHQHRMSEKFTKRMQKLGLMMSKEKPPKKDEMEIFEEKSKDNVPSLKNLNLNEECTIESIPNKRPADINTLKNKWQMSESFTQVKRNLSELSKKLDKEPKKGGEVKYSNPVKRLETNPSISVRELFPGEEEMNLQCNVEFNNVKGVTPEGWEKCNTMIQYDLETKRLWNELQRPYGNQSSFLRHLILLEKYFRSGDLVLSHNATPHAANYSDSVQSRLRAYDNVVTDAPRRSEPSISLIEFRKKPSMNGKSLLKSNQSEDKDPKKHMPPPSVAPKAKTKDKSKSKQLPPELIAINTPNAQGRKAIQNVLHNIQQLVKGVSASDPTEVAAAPLPPKFDTPPPKFETPKFDGLSKLDTPPKFDTPAPPKFDTLPKFDTPPKFDAPPKFHVPPKFDAPPKYEPPASPAPPKEKKESKSDAPRKSKASSKPWRPTLMPITQENLTKIAREPTQQAVDGRALPSLVQVMSSGKRYHITLQDYNKMCVMRREKLQQLHDGEKKRPSLDDNHIVTELQPSTMLGNGGTVTQVNSDEKIDKSQEISQIGTNAVNILKNVGLKNITIAPIPAKTATITSQTLPMPIVSSPSLIVTSTPIRIPQLSSSVSITSETVLTPNIPMLTTQMIMPKIPKSLTVIPQTVMATVPQNVVIAGTSPQVMQSTDGPRP